MTRHKSLIIIQRNRLISAQHIKLIYVRQQKLTRGWTPMASPSEKLAQSLDILHGLQNANGAAAIRAKDISPRRFADRDLARRRFGGAPARLRPPPSGAAGAPPHPHLLLRLQGDRVVHLPGLCSWDGRPLPRRRRGSGRRLTHHAERGRWVAWPAGDLGLHYRVGVMQAGFAGRRWPA